MLLYVAIALYETWTSIQVPTKKKCDVGGIFFSYYFFFLLFDSLSFFESHSWLEGVSVTLIAKRNTFVHVNMHICMK